MTRTAFILCVTILLAHGVLVAQTNTENFAQFKFNFNNPGARSAGIGGAFVSIADDATAAVANPAGLTTLIRPEVSLEVKGIEFTKTVNNFAHRGVDTSFQLVSRDFKSSLVSPSFASFVFPVNKVTLSAFRHELVNFENEFFTRGAYVPPRRDGVAFFPAASKMDMSVVNYGVGFAYKFSEAFSLGISGGVSQMDLNSFLTRYSTEVFSTGTVVNDARIEDKGSDFFVNAGLIIHAAENFSIGAIYKKSPSFELNQSYLVVSSPADVVTKSKITFNVPSSFGAGFSYRPSDVLTLAFDVMRIQYSSLTEDIKITVDENFVAPRDYTSEDGFEFHAGGEYVLFVSNLAFVLRGGVYSEPDNRIKWNGFVPTEMINTNPSTLGQTIALQAQAALFEPGETIVHGTFGIGVVISENIQLDFAGNISSLSKEGVGSIVVRF